MINLKVKIQIHTSYVVNLVPNVFMGNFCIIKYKKALFHPNTYVSRANYEE